TDMKMSKKSANSLIEQVLNSSPDIDGSGKIINSSLADGSRINIVRGEIVDDGPVITIRKFKKDPITIIDLIRNKTMTVEFAAYMWMCIEGLNANPANIIFCGGTSSGKTTTLNAFSVFIPKKSRIITIEDCFELRLPHSHVVALESTNDVSMQNLLKTTLRMRPNRILIGEVRDKEAQDLFTAMNIGYGGCMGTIHSNSTRETITRVTNKPMEVPIILIRNLDLIVMQKKKIIDGKAQRYVNEVSEISGSEGDNPLLNTVFSYNERTNVLERTNVPSRTRAKIVNDSGISIARFENILAARKKILSALAERSEKYRNIELLDILDQQSTITREQATDEPVYESNPYKNNNTAKIDEKSKENESLFGKMSSFFEEKMF
ncbi:MAG TPA: CpaF family protein, partial [Candidatus Cloacimonetes bacterium]|nr:CpaF family protein [Candidatus Cloacimonadota bacterium]